jgi:hypothetical protein
MNQRDQRRYAQIQKRVQDQMAKKFIAPVYRALKRQISSFTNEVRQYGLTGAKVPDIDPVMAKVINDIHQSAGKYSGKKVRQQLRIGATKYCTLEMQLKRGFGFNERLVQEIQEYFRMFILEKAVLPISQTTRARIETVLKEAAAEGWGVNEILARLEGPEFLDMTRRRARRIVRTETVRASNFGGMAGAWESEFETEKVWLEIKDNRTRFSHRHSSGVGGQVRDLTDPYSNGLMFPGDPNGPASETISCRCAQAYRLKRDAKGNPIRKRRTTDFYQPLANVLALALGQLVSQFINE